LGLLQEKTQHLVAPRLPSEIPLFITCASFYSLASIFGLIRYQKRGRLSL